MTQATYNLYPEIEPYQHGWYKTAGIHQIYYEQCGNPDGAPVVFLHGGPGSGCNPSQRRFFDPAHYRIILLDQRGCGRSKPLGSIEDNSTDRLVSDIDGLRDSLAIKRWLVFGGSWGSTLALAYAIAHPGNVTGLILRGIFLSRPTELSWFLGDVRHFYPEAWERLLTFLDPAERGNMLEAYAKRVFSEHGDINIPAAIQWNAYEGGMMSLHSSNGSGPAVANEVQVARARVQIHYILNECFISHRHILSEVSTLAHIPATIVQGRYDMVCPPLTAWQLQQAMPHAQLHMIPDAGHSAMEPGTTSALIAATEQYKTLT